MTRKEARENGFKIIFEYEFQKLSAEDLLALFYELNPDSAGKQTEYLNNLVEVTLKNREEIDALSAKYAKGWSIERLSKVCLATLRIGLCEMLYDENMPDNIAINEAIELAKIYEGEKAGSFVNGILSSVYKSRQ